MTDMNLSVGSLSGQVHEDTGGQLKQFKVPEQSSPGASLASLSLRCVCVCVVLGIKIRPLFMPGRLFYHETTRLALLIN